MTTDTDKALSDQPNTCNFKSFGAPQIDFKSLNLSTPTDTSSISNKLLNINLKLADWLSNKSNTDSSASLESSSTNSMPEHNRPQIEAEHKDSIQNQPSRLRYNSLSSKLNIAALESNSAVLETLSKSYRRSLVLGQYIKYQQELALKKPLESEYDIDNAPTCKLIEARFTPIVGVEKGALSEGALSDEVRSRGDEGGRTTIQLIDHLTDLEEDEATQPFEVGNFAGSAQRSGNLKLGDNDIGGVELGVEIDGGAEKVRSCVELPDIPQDIVRLENLLSIDKNSFPHPNTVAQRFNSSEMLSKMPDEMTSEMPRETPGRSSEVQYHRIQNKWDKKKRTLSRNRNNSTGVKGPPSRIKRGCCNKSRDKSGDVSTVSRDLASRELRMSKGDVDSISLIRSAGNRSRAKSCDIEIG